VWSRVCFDCSLRQPINKTREAARLSANPPPGHSLLSLIDGWSQHASTAQARIHGPLLILTGANEARLQHQGHEVGRSVSRGGFRV